MPRYIVKLTRHGEARYMEWSTIVDAPVTDLMTLGDFREYHAQMYPDGPPLEERLARVEQTGSSSLGGRTAEDVISGNRAGPGGRALTVDELWERYSA